MRWSWLKTQWPWRSRSLCWCAVPNLLQIWTRCIILLSSSWRELCSTLPPPAAAQATSTQSVQWASSAQPSQQVQYAQLIQYIVPSSQYGYSQTYIAAVPPQYTYIQPPPQVNHLVSKQQAIQPQVFLTSASATPIQSWYLDSGASHHVTNM